MELGLIGLGRMGSNIARRLLEGGHQVVVYDLRSEAARELINKGARGADTLSDMVRQLQPPRTVWVMVPAGETTETVINSLAKNLSPGDIIIDGGNSYYKDSRQMSFLDVGTSGGIWGLANGFCLMVGGKLEIYQNLEPLWRTLAFGGGKGYAYMGPSGAGHFVKMVHNGIEYGLMQAYAEGFELLQAKKEFKLELSQVAEIWQQGEGRWTVQEALELAVPLPAISASLQMRFRSRQPRPFGARLLAALRYQFGGHRYLTNQSPQE
jgi:6-phosphogluconate dehydrogenase